MPVSLASGASCDVCSEDFCAALVPHSLPCGHLLCAPCCYGILDHSSAGKVCPFCRAPFGGAHVRKLHVDFGGAVAPARQTLARLPPPAQPSVGAALHNAFCDMCSSQIIGDRYKCTDCPDYDTCSSCFVIVPDHHPAHIFVRVRSQQDYIRSTPIPPPPNQGRICTECRRPIQGVRYSCTHSNCEGVDLCAMCEAHPLASHPRNHPLIKHRVPPPPATAVDARWPPRQGRPHAAVCNGCMNTIFGVRYKCFHPLCPDYDLCAACEADPALRHPAEHPMLKVKLPTAPIPNVLHGGVPRIW